MTSLKEVNCFNEMKLVFITIIISVVTAGFGTSEVNTTFPFDEFMTPTTNETVNQSSQDPFRTQLQGEHGLSGEHGESPDDDDVE